MKEKRSAGLEHSGLTPWGKVVVMAAIGMMFLSGCARPVVGRDYVAAKDIRAVISYDVVYKETCTISAGEDLSIEDRDSVCWGSLCEAAFQLSSDNCSGWALKQGLASKLDPVR